MSIACLDQCQRLLFLAHLSKGFGKFVGKDLRTRNEAIQWLFWQMGGLGPMAGQYNHFGNYAPEKIPYAIDRYRNEVNRLYGVMNKRLADRPYLGGDQLTIGDIPLSESASTSTSCCDNGSAR